MLVFCLPSAADVVINEVMYHTVSDLDAEEYVELYNGGGMAVALDGWCLDGVAFCFPAAASIAPGGFVLLASDALAFEALYKVTGFDRMNLDAMLVYVSSLDYRQIWGGELLAQ